MDHARMKNTLIVKKVSRRRWLLRTLGAGIVGAGAVGLYTWRIEPHWVEVVERSLPIVQLPASLVGMKLVQLSDIHVGSRVDFDYLLHSFQMVNELEPDLVVITGDFMSYVNSQEIDQVARLLSTLKQPALGLVGILGNHDYGYCWQQPEVAEQLTKKLDDIGLRMLRNSIIDIQGLQLIGIDDFWATNYDAAKTLTQVDATKPCLALCHNPDAQDQPEWQKYTGWVLAGHTHGGQCKPPFLPPPLLPVKNKRYTAGHIELGNGRHLYINRGLGHLMRVRFNVRPEITLFRLEAA
jgi:uncharacterized protein